MASCWSHHFPYDLRVFREVQNDLRVFREVQNDLRVFQEVQRGF